MNQLSRYNSIILKQKQYKDKNEESKDRMDKTNKILHHIPKSNANQAMSSQSIYSLISEIRIGNENIARYLCFQMNLPQFQLHRLLRSQLDNSIDLIIMQNLIMKRQTKPTLFQEQCDQEIIYKFRQNCSLSIVQYAVKNIFAENLKNTLDKCINNFGNNIILNTHLQFVSNLKITISSISQFDHIILIDDDFSVFSLLSNLQKVSGMFKILFSDGQIWEGQLEKGLPKFPLKVTERNGVVKIMKYDVNTFLQQCKKLHCIE